MPEQLPRFAHAKPYYSFVLGEGPRVIAAKDPTGRWVEGDILRDVMEKVVHAREALAEGRVNDAARQIDALYHDLRT